MRAVSLLLILTATLCADWITPKGKSYHPRRTCMSLSRTKQPTEISKAEAEKRGLKLCGICGRVKQCETDTECEAQERAKK